MTKIIIKRLLLLLFVYFLSACGSPKKLIQLEDAHEHYSTVSRDPVVARHAALELEDAKKSLAKANRHWLDGDKKSVVEHHAYMTDQKLVIAQYRSRLLENNVKLSELTLEYQQAQRAASEQEDTNLKNSAMVESRQVEGMIIKANELEGQVNELAVTQTQRGLVLTLGHELFDYDNANLTHEAVANIAKVARFMNEYPKQNVLIEGHTDTIGDESYNQELSARQAESVKFALVRKGVTAERIVTRGLGESTPRVGSKGKLAHMSNRRVEIIFEKEPNQHALKLLSLYK